jgi:hypothetical protein
VSGGSPEGLSGLEMWNPGLEAAALPVNQESLCRRISQNGLDTRILGDEDLTLYLSVQAASSSE